MQIDKSTLQPGLILLPRRAVHPRRRFPLQCVEARLEQIDCEVVEQCGELHLLVFLRGFPHTHQPLGHVCPALRRVRAGLTSVFLAQRPSLLTLRRRPSVLVRMIHRYYATVRLLGDVHAGCTAIAFSRRPATIYGGRCLPGLPVLVQEVSRRVWGLRLRRTAQGLALAPLTMLPSAGLIASASRLHVFEAPYPAHLFPCLCFTVRLTTPSAKLGAEWIATPFS